MSLFLVFTKNSLEDRDINFCQFEKLQAEMFKNLRSKHNFLTGFRVTVANVTK